jgi:hypothetical protein
VSTRLNRSADLLASGRRRVEETNEPWASIALDFSLHPRSMQRLAKHLGWKRKARPRRTVFTKENNGGRPPTGITPELEAVAQHKVEHTSESTTAIAAQLQLHHSTLLRLIRLKGWVRPEASQRRRDLPPAVRVAAAADALVTASGQGGDVGAAASEPHDLSAVDRLEQAVLKELATVETMRASLGREPLRPMDAERTARTLSVLTETLAKLRRLRLAAAPQTGPDHDDDMPADIDEFRNEFARRIDAFIASRAAQGDAGGEGGTAVVEEAP